MTPEQLEWERAARHGRSRALRAALRVLVSFLVAGAVGAGVFVAQLQYEEARAAQLTLAMHEGRSLRPPRSHGLRLVALPVGAGFVTFLALFHLLGGRLSAEHWNGLRRD
jgi:hypothetical protein